jgi:hypothetical protein
MRPVSTARQVHSSRRCNHQSLGVKVLRGHPLIALRPSSVIDVTADAIDDAELVYARDP